MTSSFIMQRHNTKPPATKAARVIEWRAGVQTRAEARNATPQRITRNQLPLQADARYYAGTLRCPQAGTLVITLASPRPLRVFLDGQLALDEELYWRLYQRELRAAIVVPCSKGEMAIQVEVGARPSHPAVVDSDAPSRDREHTLAEVRRLRPDVITFDAHVTKEQTLPALSLRFSPGQFRQDGVTYQSIQAHMLPDYSQMPSTERWSPAERTFESITLTTPVDPGLCIEDVTTVERRQFFAPVLAAQQTLPALRDFGKDARPEPILEIAGETTLTIEGPRGTVQVPLPIYEGLGRNAPQREYKKVQWPAAGALREAVPQPILPENLRHLTEVYHGAWVMLMRLSRAALPHSGLPGDYISTGAGFKFYQFVWDTAFAACCTAYGCRALDPYASLNVLYSRQFDGGYINREHDVRDGLPALYEPGFSPNPPLMSVVEWQIANITGNVHRLRRVYPSLKGYHEWLRHNRKLPDGTYWTTGLANGLDNSPSLGDGYPDLTAQMAHDAEMLALIGDAIGENEEAAAYRAERDAIAQACNAHLWSESMQIYSTSLHTGGHNPNKVVTAFWPLWAGIVPPDRIDALAQHAADPSSFWRHHPFPSLAADSPRYVPEGQYWLGSTWPPTNYAAIKGFHRAGQHALAREAALRHVQCVWEVFRSTSNIWENYCAEASKQGNWAGPDYCWSALGPIALLIEVVIGIEADALHRTLRWRIHDEQRIGIRKFPLGHATIDVVHGRDSDGRWGIDVDTDRPFTLVVIAQGRERRFECGAGHSRLLL
jgi:hypothetical protein